MKSITGLARRLWNSPLSLLPSLAACSALCGIALIAQLGLANPWVAIANPVNPGPSILLPAPNQVPGKDFSDVRDRDAAGAPDVEQLVAWDGSGGVRDSLDYSGSRAALLPPPITLDIEVDGIAAGGDALFQALRDNQAALLISVETDPRIMYSRATGFPAAPAGTGVWALPADIDFMNPPLDTDGLELWGGDNNDDSDRYSLFGDPSLDTGAALRKVAVWQFTPPGGPSAAHTFTSDLAEAMDRQFGGNGSGPVFGQLVELMDVDAIMTFGPKVTYSIRPISFEVPGAAGPPIQFDFDGGEIFEYDSAGVPTRYLKHGGLTYDTLLDIKATFGVTHENIDALEAAAEFVPEPSSIMLLMLGLMVLPRTVGRRR